MDWPQLDCEGRGDDGVGAILVAVPWQREAAFLRMCLGGSRERGEGTGAREADDICSGYYLNLARAYRTMEKIRCFFFLFFLIESKTIKVVLLRQLLDRDPG